MEVAFGFKAHPGWAALVALGAREGACYASVVRARKRWEAFSVVVLATAAVSCTEEHSCTAIGCVDGWSLTLREADGSAPTHAVELDIDGTRVACPQVSPDVRFATCADSVMLQLVDEVVCEEHESNGNRTQVCTPTGRFEEIVSVNGTPSEVVVALRDGDTVTGERTFEPDYETTQPNGPDCGPTCHQASDGWELP